MYVSDCLFLGNTADVGAAIWSSGTGVVSQNVFQINSARAFGPAILDLSEAVAVSSNTGCGNIMLNNNNNGNGRSTTTTTCDGVMRPNSIADVSPGDNAFYACAQQFNVLCTPPTMAPTELPSDVPTTVPTKSPAPTVSARPSRQPSQSPAATSIRRTTNAPVI
ncbi:hypothetical protein ACA910_001914 [Epithemia clementina (nom. ined.)]